MKRIIINFSLILFAVLVISCEEIVNIDLNSSSPQVVIEGVITDLPGPYQVVLSYTTDYYNPATPPPISGALVIIIDSESLTDTLREISAGIYQTSNIQGRPGRQYHLQVDIGGNRFTATSTMPDPVPISSLEYTREEVGFGDKKKVRFELNCIFQDDPKVENFNSFRVSRNGAMERHYFLYNDRLSNGNLIRYRRFGRIEFEEKDMVTVHLLAIDQPAYEYYNTLNAVLASDPRGPASKSVPANPNSNIVGGALGYFSAYAVTVDSIRLEE